LSSVYIEAVNDDDAGTLWVTGVTASGEATLMHVDPDSGSVKYYFASDGINAVDFFDGVSIRIDDGTLYFGSLQGFTIVQPHAVRSNAIAPELAVVAIKAAGRVLAKMPFPDGVALDGGLNAPRRLTLPWNRANFSVQFAALHFADPERNRYAYRLDGLDTDWNNADVDERTANYANLAPGDYTLHIKAANKNGVWATHELAMAVVVPPPFWATWWFRVSAVVTATGLLTLLHRWRVASLERRQLRLERLVQGRTGELMRKNLALSDAYAALENLSVTDPLTKLHNRRFLEQKLPDDLNLVLRRHESGTAPANASMIFFLIDLDHFKQVNDRYGHAAGDQVLVEVRKRLQQVFRDSDYLVRWGGEEFLAVARDTDAVGAGELANRIRAAIAETAIKLEDGTGIGQTCSIGYACFPFSVAQPRLLNWEQVLQLADLGLYAAKHGGRAAWVGLTCGVVEIESDQICAMMQEPVAALAAGQLRATSSFGDDVLLRAWG